MKRLLAVLFSMVLFAASYATADGDFLITTPGGAPAIAVAGIYAETPDALRKHSEALKLILSLRRSMQEPNFTKPANRPIVLRVS